MIKYLEELNEFLTKHDLNTADVCIVGSTVFSLKGIREHNDLDFILRPDVYKKLNKTHRFPIGITGHHPVSSNVDIYKNRYYINSITDKDIFEQELFFQLNGYNIIYPEVEYVYKSIKGREKDKKDLKRIDESKDSWSEYDDNLVKELLEESLKRKKKKEFILKLEKVIKDPHLIVNRIKRKKR